MSIFFQRATPVLIVLGLAAVALLWHPPAGSLPPASNPNSDTPLELSVLGEKPDWPALEIYQHTITRADFERLLNTVFTTDDAWKNWIETNETSARIHTGRAGADELFRLRFAPPGTTGAPNPRHWNSGEHLPPAPPGKPLKGLHIAIDPGHIGGQWAQLEQRGLRIGDGPPIREGDMTLSVAKLLKPRLEALGAKVSLVRETHEPVTRLRPQSLLALARKTSESNASPAALQSLAERLFYRTAEIHARAQVVNQTLKPDLVLCLHFNADAWGNPLRPTLVPRSHLHLLLNGAYTHEELALADQRFSLIEKLLSRSHEEELSVANSVANTFAETSGLPPFVYHPGSANALPVKDHPYLWIRNLLANRLYRCPVIFMEPYVMNSSLDHPRLQAGDYPGLRLIQGKTQASIFREYADAVTEGLARHYRMARSGPK
jgi:N-acetylmuramoyl-L-alanine amidase